MEFNREEDIRNCVEAWLKQQNIPVEREVSCGNGIRADLVTPDTVIEVKKYLNRGAIYQAHGQGVTYQKHLSKPKLLIIGLAPTSATRYQEAQRIAENIQREGVEVVFIDKDPKWAIAAASVAKASTAAGKLPAKSVTTVQLPFEPSVPTPAKSAKSTANQSPDSNSTSDHKKAPTMGDFWAILLIILLFLWVRAALMKFNQPNRLDSQPSPEVTIP